MASNITAFSGVGVAGVSRTLPAVAPISVAALLGAVRTPAAGMAPAWPAAAFWAPAAAPSTGIPMQRKRRAATTAATGASVKRGTT
jgi:hypothetical protein